MPPRVLCYLLNEVRDRNDMFLLGTKRVTCSVWEYLQSTETKLSTPTSYLS
jgi:hypothetical protein